MMMVGLDLLVMLICTGVLYEQKKQSIITDIDNMLQAVVIMAREFLPPDYHERIKGPESVTDEEFQTIVDRHNRLCVSLKIDYIWSLMVVDGQIVFTSSTSPDKIAANRRHAKFFEVHSNPELYAKAFETMTPTFQTNRDKWGNIRVALFPETDRLGRKYLFGAGEAVADVNRQLPGIIIHSLLIGLALFFIFLLMVLWITRVVTSPIKQLTAAIMEVVAGEGSFAADENGTTEVSTLAHHVNRLNRALQGKITVLETSSEYLRAEHEKERQQALDALKISEQRYRGVLNFAVDGILMGSHEGIITEANECMCSLFGMKREEIVGKHISQMPFSPESLANKPFRFDLVCAGQTVVTERTIRRSDGTEIVVELHSKMMADGTLQSIYHDVTERNRTELALRNSEDRYHQLFDMESDALFLIDNATGRILDVNLAAQALYGYSRDELLAMRNVELSAEPDQTQQATRKATEEQLKPLRIGLRRHRKRDGTVVAVEITARGFTINGQPVHLAAMRDITEREKARQVLESWNEELEKRVAERTNEVESYAHQLRALTGKLVRVEEDERQRISVVLHEDLQQTLAASRMTLGTALGMVKVPRVQEALSSADKMLVTAIKLTRSLVHEMAVPSVREGDVLFAMEWLSQQVLEKFGMHVNVTADDGLPTVDEHVYLCVYRSVQEVLFNIVKHAQVLCAELSVRMEGAGCIRITISDQGCGFSTEGTASNDAAENGFGLFSMRERIEGLGGQMRIISAVGKGTTIILIAPARG